MNAAQRLADLIVRLSVKPAISTSDYVMFKSLTEYSRQRGRVEGKGSETVDCVPSETRCV